MEKGLTHEENWEDIDLQCFEMERDKLPTHMIHLITKFLTNTLPVMQILHRRQYATSYLCP